jgi:predicted metal-dependent phosphoesterase TrpH
MTGDAASAATHVPALADLHTHPLGDGRFGADAEDRVARHLEAALNAGLQVIGVTDHDEMRTAVLAVAYAERNRLPLVVVPGVEVTTCDGHLVVLGTDVLPPAWQTMAETIAWARQAGALVLLPHPFFLALRARTDVDAMERLNARYGDFDVRRDDIAVVANSDAHVPADLLTNPHRTLLRVTELSPAGVLEAVRSCRSAIVDA